MANTDVDNQEPTALRWYAIPVALWMLAALWPFIKIAAEPSAGIDKLGQFGDSFGALNALFSGLAFAGLLITLRLQQTELRLQREEMRATAAELKRSADAHASFHDHGATFGVSFSPPWGQGIFTGASGFVLATGGRPGG